MSVNLRRLSRTMAVALRHRPKLYNLELDKDGWTSIHDLRTGIQNRHSDLAETTEQDIREAVFIGEKQRYEINKDRIRALHGHSTPDKIPYPRAEPPTLLYHGTSRPSVEVIRKEGLKPMTRQYVHLTANTILANTVGKRKAPQVVVLTIRAEEAHFDGISFYKSSELVWLVDELPPEYIDFPESLDDNPA